MADLQFEHIKKIYEGGFCAVPDFNLEIKDREFMVFVGPSGCGKSTTLRMIAGLEEISGGELRIGGKRVNEVEPKDRDIAMVFQNYALYPHMTVRENMSYALKIKKMPRAQIDEKVNEAARILGLEQVLDRKPRALSGGQRQRVALGRAIVRDPKVFLMDEPLSNLDAKLRVQTRAEIIRLHERLQTTFVYVTHDQTEAMTMGDRIVIMNNGVIQQVDTPHNVYFYPQNEFVAGFIGSPQMNFFSARVLKEASGCFVTFLGTTLPLPGRFGRLLEKAGKLSAPLTLGVRPEHLYVAPRTPGMALEADIDLVELLGSEKHLHCRAGDEEFLARISSDHPARAHEKLILFLDAAKLHFFDPESGANLTLEPAQKSGDTEAPRLNGGQPEEGDAE
ncbi:MAG: sn-glycerol-3-phosphate ABC transporter ATP-binding protein UgpC [Ndongobacter sp.]|nr:sn-glycerol-3-phosphate ABC transporter ATP-binding protein UgpC [Ndongobacter sp.]